MAEFYLFIANFQQFYSYGGYIFPRQEDDFGIKVALDSGKDLEVKY